MLLFRHITQLYKEAEIINGASERVEAKIGTTRVLIRSLYALGLGISLLFGWAYQSQKEFDTSQLESSAAFNLALKYISSDNSRVRIAGLLTLEQLAIQDSVQYAEILRGIVEDRLSQLPDLHEEGSNIYVLKSLEKHTLVEIIRRQWSDVDSLLDIP